MINTAGKFAFGVAAVALAVSIGYRIAVGDRAGFVILIALTVAAILLGLALSGSGANDRASWVDPEAPINEVPVGRSAATRPSWWPLGLGVAATVAFVGMAVSGKLLGFGIVLILVAAVGWLLQAWRDHPGWTRRADARFTDRVVAPLAVPLGALALILVIVLSVSRVLLAVNEKVSVAIAAVCAFFILAAFAFVASRPRTGRNLLTALGAVTLVAVAGAGVAGAAKGPREFEKKDEQKQVTVVAKNTQFGTAQITLDAKAGEQVLFRNEDPGIYHNISVYTQVQGGKPLEAGPPIRGVEKKLYTFQLQPGTYGFRCDFHANMVGTLVVQ